MKNMCLFTFKDNLLKKIVLTVFIFTLMACFQVIHAHETKSSLSYFMQGNNPAPSRIQYGNNTVKGHYVFSSDARIYYEVYGDGSPVVVLHGGGVGSPYEMGQLIDSIAKHHKVFVVSSRGHGHSEIGHTAISLEQKASDVNAILEQNSIDKAILLGFSDGAYTAYQIAAMYPEKTDRVIAIGAGTLNKGFFSGELKLSDLEKIDSRFVKQQLSIRPEPERWQEFLSEYMKYWSQQEIGEDFFSKIKAPVLLIVGDEDDHAPVKTVLKAHQLLKNSSLLVVPHAWHSAFIDNYPVKWEAIEDFIGKPSSEISSSKKVAFND